MYRFPMDDEPLQLPIHSMYRFLHITHPRTYSRAHNDAEQACPTYTSNITVLLKSTYLFRQLFHHYKCHCERLTFHSYTMYSSYNVKH